MVFHGLLLAIGLHFGRLVLHGTTPPWQPGVVGGVGVVTSGPLASFEGDGSLVPLARTVPSAARQQPVIRSALIPADDSSRIAMPMVFGAEESHQHAGDVFAALAAPLPSVTAGMFQKSESGSGDPSTRPALTALPSGNVADRPAGDGGARSGVGFVHYVHPRYPEAARRRGYSGVATVSMQCDADGRVLAATVIHSSGHRDLDDSALEAAAHWQIEPQWLDGNHLVRVPVVFNLASAP